MSNEQQRQIGALQQQVDALQRQVDTLSETLETRNGEFALKFAALEALRELRPDPPASRNIIDHEGAARAVSFAQVSGKVPSAIGRDVSITHPHEEPTGTPPTEDEHLKLLSVVFGKIPGLRPAETRTAEFQADYRSAFEALRRVGRAEKPDPGKSVSWWIEEFRYAHLLGAEVRSNAFLAAVLAHGDIPYVRGNGANISWELGLVLYGTSRRPTGDAWRKVLQTGELLRPSPLARPLTPEERAVERAVNVHRV